MEFTIRFSKRERYAKADRYLYAHPEKYRMIVGGRDYSDKAIMKDKRYGCGFYITYKKLV